MVISTMWTEFSSAHQLYFSWIFCHIQQIQWMTLFCAINLPEGYSHYLNSSRGFHFSALTFKGQGLYHELKLLVFFPFVKTIVRWWKYINNKKAYENGSFPTIFLRHYLQGSLNAWHKNDVAFAHQPIVWREVIGLTCWQRYHDFFFLSVL